MTNEPARVSVFHVPAKPDYQVDQIRRYMRRHQGTAMFINGDVDQSLTVEELSGLTRGEIRQYFNAARKRGLNQ